MTGPSECADSSIFKSLDLSPSNDELSDEEPPKSTRMNEALRLRQKMNPSDASARRKLMASELPSPRPRSVISKMYEDTEELDEEEDLALTSPVAQGDGAENREPNVKRGAARSALLAKLNLKNAQKEVGRKAKGSGKSITTSAFQNQLSSRFKTTKHQVRRLASSDNEDSE